MSTHSLDITVTGWIGSDVRLFPAQDGRAAYTTFRVGSTRRWFDRDSGAWRDGRTEWFTVKAWRALAVNAAASLHKGDPVVVTGRLSTREWMDAEARTRTSLVVEAAALGHDLGFGSARFARTVGPAAAGEGEARGGLPGPDRVPLDVSGLTELEDEPAVPDRFVPAGDVLEEDDDLADDDVDGGADDEAALAELAGLTGRR